MKATLLIKNIENLYTCDKEFRILSRAYIAIHHDKIIDVGIGSYSQWIDSATRVIDAVGEIVLPGFIDVSFAGFAKVRLGDQLRENSTALFAMRQNGILTLLTKDPKIQRKELSQDVFIQKKEVPYPILQREAQYKLTKPSKFLLSCGFGLPNSYVYSFQPLCYALFNTHHVDKRTLLESMTSLPAACFDLNDRGNIQKGMLADLLILQVPTIEHYFQTLGRPLIHRMIKNGIQFYPEWMVC